MALSLALMKREPVAIKNGYAFIENNFDLMPLFNDIKRIVSETGAGMLGDSGDDIIFNPDGLFYGAYNFETDKFSSISEIELFLMPSLFYHEFRSALNFTGVTHSHLSYPTTFIKETLLAFLESTGHYASLNLKRFGFYGSGGGFAESKIYPAEPKKCGNVFELSAPEIEGVRIFMAKMNMEMAGREKEFIIKNTGIDENRVQIMEIVDADGYGNSIHVYVKCGGVNVILSRDMEIYNSAGDFVFEESRYYTTLTGLLHDTEMVVKLKTLPVYLMDEILPYLMLSGSEVPEELKSSACYAICREIL
jgi:RNA 3'-terminal phosphate cyclase